jgi:hypothetical protein
LHGIASALGTIVEFASEGKIKILRTRFFEDLLVPGTFNWTPSPLKREIFTLLNQLLMAGGNRVIIIEGVDQIEDYTPHPLPASCVDIGALEDYWADEVGRLLAKHDACINDGSYCIGVACESGFLDGTIGSYSPPNKARFFPLVGKSDCDCSHLTSLLKDAFEYVIPDHIRYVSISFEEAKKNLHLIGGKVSNPSGGSHHPVQFPGARTWILDSNDDPVPDTYLNQLKDKTGYPILVIKYALKNGALPPQVLRVN